MAASFWLGCGDAAPPGATAADATPSELVDAAGGTADAPAVLTDAAAAPRCTGFTTPPRRDYTVMLAAHDDQPERTALVHVPPGYDARTPAPLVLNLHGNLMTAELQEMMTHMNPAADARGVVTVHPQGTGDLLSGWNAGRSPLGDLYSAIDDVGFLRSLIDQVSTDLCIDRQRVYCAGFSLGGSMCYRLGCELADHVAALASVSGPDGTETCNPSRATALLHIHGTADTFAPYNGGSDPNDPNRGAPTYVAAWAMRDGCASTPQNTLMQGAVSCQTYSECRDGADVTLCTVTGGGHTWPGGEGWPFGGVVNQDIQATPMILDFFARFPRR
jgi:polyhydroxybutyrate depolymerase